jgi:uncharacterized YigZ family protein
MKTISREAEISIEIKRSKFIGRSFRCPAPEEALAAVRKIRESARDATHHCWAYRVGITGEQARYQDDGEPQGTAGPPILEVLKKSEVTNTLIVVTRYYGGIKLGAGGLARAYREAAKGVLDESRPKDLRLLAEIEAPVPYPLLGAFENRLAQEGAEILEKTFGETVLIRLRLPAEREPSFRSVYDNLVGGKLVYTIIGRDYR